MERQRQELGLGNNKWKTGITFDKTNDTKKEQSLIHMTENLLDIIYDNFDCPLFWLCNETLRGLTFKGLRGSFWPPQVFLDNSKTSGNVSTKF